MGKEILQDDTDRLLSVEEVAERLRTGKQFVRRLINAGILPALSFRRKSDLYHSCSNVHKKCHEYRIYPKSRADTDERHHRARHRKTL